MSLIAGIGEIGKSVNPLRIAFADEDDKWRLVNDALCCGHGCHSSVVAPPSTSLVGIAIDRQYRDIGRSALQDLIRYGFANRQTKR